MRILSRKLLYFSCSVWKKIIILKKKAAFKSSEKFIYSRGSYIPRIFRRDSFYIHNGKIWQKKLITRWTIGFKFGEFVATRMPAVYKAKQLRKKKMKKMAKKK